MDPLRPQDPHLPEQQLAEEAATDSSAEQPTEEPTNDASVEQSTEELTNETSSEQPAEELTNETSIDQPTEEPPNDASVEEPAEEMTNETSIDQPTEELPNDASAEQPAQVSIIDSSAAQPSEESTLDSSAELQSDIESTPPTTPPEEGELPRPWLRHYPKEIAPSLVYPNDSIVQFLLNAVNKYPGHTAIHFLGKTMTYRELHTDAVRLASGLISLGLAKGDRVAIMLPNCPQAVVAYYGILLAGGVVVQTNPLYVERELQHQLLDSGAVGIITVDLLYDRLSRVRGEQPELGPLPLLQHVVVTSIKDGLPFPKNMLYPIKQRKEGFRSKIPYGRLGVVSYKKLLAQNSQAIELPSLAEGHEVAVLQYTGGTTGTPKGVMLTHRNLVANTMQISAWCYKAIDGKERFLAALPLFHVFGLTVLMNMSVLRAGMLILLPRFETEVVLKTISKLHPTIFPGAPTMYVALINHNNVDKSDLSSINICVSGSAALPLEVQEQFESLTGGRLIEGYGLSEASPVTHANPVWGHRKIGTVGIPFPDTEVQIIDPATGESLPIGQLGELVVRGPQVMKGYWNKPEETAQVLRDGWLYTGDLATMDEDGFFTIMDRMKDVIIAGGFNIYPREVEEVLYEHPAIREAAVIGVKDSYRGETVKAFIVLKEGWQVSREQLDVWCRERLASYKVPHQYTFRETLPKTMIGKVLRRKLYEEDAEAEKTAGDKGR